MTQKFLFSNGPSTPASRHFIRIVILRYLSALLDLVSPKFLFTLIVEYSFNVL